MAKLAKAPALLGFFKTLGASLYSPRFYTEIPKHTFGRAFWFFARLALLTSAGIMLMVGVPILAVLLGSAGNLDEKILEAYPDELVITINQGKVSTNVEEPYSIPIPFTDNELQKFPSEFRAQNLIVIDTKTPFTSAQFEAYKTLAWLTQDSLFFYNSEEAEIGGYPLKNVKKLEITEQAVQTFVEKVMGMMKWLAPMIGLMMWAMLWTGTILWGLGYALLLAVLISILKSVLGQNASYGASYLTALYAMTWAVVFNILLTGLNAATGFESFTFLVTLLTMVAVGWNLRKARA